MVGMLVDDSTGRSAITFTESVEVFPESPKRFFWEPPDQLMYSVDGISTGERYFSVSL